MKLCDYEGEEKMRENLLQTLLEVPSVSGDEFSVRKVLKEYMGDSFEENTDSIGDSIYFLDGFGEKRILMTAHIDEIGLLVTGATENGFLKVTNAGGFNAKLYVGHGVKICTANGEVYGSVVVHSNMLKNNEFTATDILIDIGAKTKEEAFSKVQLGNAVVFDTHIRQLMNDRVSARGLDDKSGVYVVMETLKRMREKQHKATIIGAGTVGEETSQHGAVWVANRVKPTEAIVVDVTYTSDYEGMTNAKWGEVELGKGPVLCINPICDKKINQKLMELAKEKGIPYQVEVSGERSCTDADEIHIVGKGVPVVLVSIPLRYMHSPAEVVDKKDLEYTVELLTAYLENA
ncbi:M20/M25/M40 family metallo-hydrolase [Faecalimonas sp.]